MIPLPEPIAFANDLTVYFEPGRTYALDELPPRSIALDGAVRGPAFDTATERYSFDHHEGVIRHVTLATCEQVYDALRVGLDPRGFHVVLNDLDGDTVLSLWLLLHPEAVRGDGAARVEELVRRFGRVDALGPGWGEPHAVHAALTPSRKSKQSVSLLRGYLKIVDNWWSAGVVPRPPAREPARGFWFDASGHVVHGEVAQMTGLYEHASVGVLYDAAPHGTTAYTIAKRSEFVPYDVRAFLFAMNEREPGWGGGSTVGGAPRHPDGSRSRLTVEEVAAVFEAVAKKRG